MKIILSPAKIMNEDESYSLNNSSIILKEESKKIISYLKSLSKKEFSKQLKLKGNLLDINYTRILNFENEKSYPAIHLYGGMVYKNIDIENIKNNKYIEKNVTILSALYGPIPAYKSIKPYRLDFNTNINIDGEKLKDLWCKSYNDYFNDDQIVLNLASQEFSSLINKDKLNWIDFSFHKMDDNNKLKSHSTSSKKARGLMLRYLANNNINDLNDVKGFDYDGFQFNKGLSTSSHLVFIKK